MNLIKLAACITSTSLLIACGGGGSSSDTIGTSSTPAINMANAQKVIDTNADIALAAYTDSVVTAKDLKAALATFKETPNAENLEAAKKAWLVSREPYGQTEVYRFRNSPIDSTDYSSEDGPEGDINAWPLGEALIDYVETNTAGSTTGPNEKVDFGDDQVGVKANQAGINGNGKIDVDYIETNPSDNIIGNTNIVINADLLANTATADDEHDVIAGYHAIEFLLWGQDLNNNAAVTKGNDRDNAVKTFGASNLAAGGQRPIEDFVPGIAEGVSYDSTKLSHRRHQFLEVAVDKLIADLEAVQAGWEDDVDGNYRDQFTTIDNEADAKQKLTEILTGMGTLSEGELAGERMQIAFSVNSQEDEHSCFSDNTHRDIWLNAEGVSNSFYGTYAGYDHDLDPETPNQVSAGNRSITGYGIDDYLTDVGLTNIVTEVKTALELTEANYTEIDTSARAGFPFDVLIMNPTEDSDVFKTIKSLSAQARLLQTAADKLGLGNVVDEEASSCDTKNPTSECE